MKRLAWLNDIHLNFISGTGFEVFMQGVLKQAPDAILIGGDISDARSVGNCLAELERAVQCPIYFVLGNHDYYHGSIASVRALISQIAGALRPHPQSGPGRYSAESAGAHR